MDGFGCDACPWAAWPVLYVSKHTAQTEEGATARGTAQSTQGHKKAEPVEPAPLGGNGSALGLVSLWLAKHYPHLTQLSLSPPTFCVRVCVCVCVCRAQIIAFLLSKKAKVTANEYERRGLCFTPRGTQINTKVTTTVIEQVRVLSHRNRVVARVHDRT